MSTFSIFLVLIVIVAFLLIVVIMVQNPKGGGLSSSFGGGTQQLGGVKKTTDFLDKSTWTLATILLVLILVSNVAINRGVQTFDSKALDIDSSARPLEQVPPVQQPLPETQTSEPSTDKSN